MAQMNDIPKEPGHERSGSAPSHVNGVVKCCSRCKIEKPGSDFRVRSNGRGLESWCNKCKNEYAKTRYRKDAGYRQRVIDRVCKQQRENPKGNRERQRQWRARNPGKKRAYGREYAINNRNKLALKESRRRAKKMDAFVEDVDPVVVFNRDNGICGICGNAVDKKDFAIDHIIPLSRGGKHSYGNTQLAHPLCNSKKGAKMPEEMVI